MSFVPDKTAAVDVPFFESVRADSGWQGQGTHKKLAQLERDVAVSLARLGGSGVLLQRGKFIVGNQERQGYQITYSLSNGAQVMRARLDLAALPLRKTTPAKITDALKMALYMAKMALDGAWFLEQMSPGYAALLPWMLAPGEDRTLTEAWTQVGAGMGNLLPPGSEFIDGEFKDAE